jgi:hypothetical protein
LSRIIYTEEQRMNMLWLKLLMGSIWLGIFILFGVALYYQFILKKPMGDDPVSDAGLIIIFFVSILPLAGTQWLLRSMRLITEVREDGLYFRYPPFINRFKVYVPGQIKEYEVRKYQPIKEYGGWGLRMGNKKVGWAYNASGDMGLQLVLADGQRILIGTARPDALKKAMDRMMNKSPE